MKIVADCTGRTYLVWMHHTEICRVAGLPYYGTDLHVGMEMNVGANVDHVNELRSNRDKALASARNLRALADLLERELHEIGLHDEPKKGE